MHECGSDGKESACKVGDLGSIPGSGRSPGEGNGNPFQYSCLKNPMDGDWVTLLSLSVRYKCESWTIKKAEPWKTDTFELWCCRRLLRVPWTARRSNQSILKEISPGCSLEGMMLKLKVQYFGHLMWRVHSLEKTDAGRDWGQEEKGTTEDEMAGWHHRLDAHESEWTPGVGDGQGGLACCNSWGRKESGKT